MKYDLILLDVDNTLIDFDHSENRAIEKVFSDNGLTLSDEILTFYIEKNKELWKRLETGEVSRDFVLMERFNQTFNKFDLKADARKVNIQYQMELGESPILFNGAIKVCTRLVKVCKLAIVTNGTKIAQDKKLKQTGLDQLIEHIFISEQVGYNKPDKRFFDYVFGVVGDYPKHRVLIVGDSLTSDIRGGNNIGIDTCWVNLHNQINTIEKVDYEISDISKLLEIIV